MKITVAGAAGEVTGSCYVLNDEVLVDCGLFQGNRFAEKKNENPFPFDAKKIKYVFITHAHLDHTGRLPKLVKEGFSGKIFATGPTIDFAKIVLKDAVHILEEEDHPIYTQEDVNALDAFFEPVEYHQTLQLDGYEITFYDAGHILGSSIIKIITEGKSVVFSGDVGNPPVPILQPTENISSADYLFVESTYGGRVHETTEERISILQRTILETIQRGGVLMIPAFALERTQEILYELNELRESNQLPECPIFLDSPMAIEATEIFGKYKNLFNAIAENRIQSGDDIFRFPGLRFTKTTEESKSINNVPPPKVIIAGSGMCHGGRIVHHLFRYIEDPKSTVLIVGYQVAGSLGRRLLDGEKSVRIHREEKTVRARILAVGGYSAHADQPKLLKWIQAISGLKKIFIIHSEEDQRKNLQQALSGYNVSLPTLGETFVL